MNFIKCFFKIFRKKINFFAFSGDRAHSRPQHQNNDSWFVSLMPSRTPFVLRISMTAREICARS